ncbi:hypothetical protein HE1_00589 [Holospora elegans E1]|uniref:Uncharacterized protein n=1 Tax=Holospora elegans E1 TaxID=1427503 RepID=A0A023DZC5_9PROT|nr:hypothetical protein HE1_00589 [Holospora elegans E1]
MMHCLLNESPPLCWFSVTLMSLSFFDFCLLYSFIIAHKIFIKFLDVNIILILTMVQLLR